MKTHILILGGGYTAVWTYKNCIRFFEKDILAGKVKITVVSLSDFHSFHGFTSEVISGILPAEVTRSPLQMLMPLAEIVKGNVERIDVQSQRVEVRISESQTKMVIGYDQLVISTGTSANTSSFSGLKESGIDLKAVDAADTCRNRIVESIRKAQHSGNPAEQKKLLTFFVAGAGFTGLEIATNVHDLLLYCRRYFPILEYIKPQIYIVGTGSSVLKELNNTDQYFIDYSMKYLKKSGIKYIGNSKIVRAIKEGIYLENGNFISGYNLISAIGNQVNLPIGCESFLRDNSGRITVDENLRIPGISNVWVGGDLASVKHISGNYICPPNALWAIKHGTWIGKNLIRSYRKKELLKFDYKGLGKTASFGLGKGFLELYGIKITGWMSWISRMAFFLWFMPLKVNAFRVVLYMLLLPFLERNISGSARLEKRIASEKKPVFDMA